jgi:tetratricopeptide (TPR) repeat protein
VVIGIQLLKPLQKAIVALATLVLCSLLAALALTEVIGGLLTDERTRAGKPQLSSGLKYAPKSAPLRARLAAAEMLSEDRDLSVAEADARLAVNLAPWDYNHRLLLATIQEAKGDRAAAEAELLEAVRLAPNYAVVRWRLANVLVRQGKLGKSLSAFRAANTSSGALLPSSLDLVWRVSGGNLAAAQAITPDDAKSKIFLTQFLIQQSRAAEAAGIFSSIDPGERLAQPESSAIIGALIAGGHTELARFLWADTVSHGQAKQHTGASLIWNGGFETDIIDNLAQFDWTIGQSPYATSNVSGDVAHNGARSLRLDFTGRDTTRLDDEVSQKLLVRPGAAYRLEFYVRTEGVVTPEGPRVVVSDSKSSPAIAASEPVPAGSNDWRRESISFVAPATSRSVVVAIRRIPRFSYDDPTKGTIWFDDFTLTELGKAQ